MFATSLLAFQFIACGLPSIPIIDPPIDPAYAEGTLNSPGQQVLSFTHNPDNNVDDFRGYVLYYKLYPPTDSPLSSSIESDRDFIEATPRDTGPRRLQTRGFRRLVSVTNRDGNSDAILEYIDSDPDLHLPLDPTGTPIVFELDLRQPSLRNEGSVDTVAENTEIVVTWNQGGEKSRGFRRRSTTESSESTLPQDRWEGFWYADGYDAGDPDIYRALYEGETFDVITDPNYNGELTIVLYVLTYATDATTFRPYYSEPLRLPEATLVVE